MFKALITKQFMCVLFFIVLISIFCPNFPYSYEQISDETLFSHNNEYPTFKSISNGIIITSDEDFSQKAGEYSWSGNGSEFNPYVISNYIFYPRINPIRIYHTRAYFILSNNTMNESNVAVELINVSNAKIVQNTIIDPLSKGILITDCYHVQITSNRVKGSKQNGIEIENSPQTCVYNNSIIDMQKGIILDYSPDCFISRNSISECRIIAMDIIASTNCTLFSNVISNPQGSGLTITNSDHLTISDNFINNTQDYGVHLKSSTKALISKNFVQNCDNGLVLESASNYAEIYDNEIINNDNNGIVLDESSHCIISSNTIMNNMKYGLKLESCTNLSIKWNDFIKNNENSTNSQGFYEDGTLVEFQQNFWDDRIGDAYSLDGLDLLIDSDPRFFHSPLTYLIPSFNFLSPTGGEWLNGIIDIEWEMVLNFDTDISFSIYASSDAGWTWTNLVSNHGNDSWEWNSTTFSQTSRYIIQVISSSPEEIKKVVYSNIFIIHSDIIPPRITYPLSQDTVTGRPLIQWDAGSDTNHSGVRYSLWISKNLEDWIVIAKNVVNNQYIWNSSEVPDGDYYLKVVLHCPEDLTAEDTLLGTFTIDNHYLTPVTIIDPHEDAVLNGKVTINWTASEDSQGYKVHYSLFYSDDEGNSWTLIAINLTDTDYLWDTTLMKNGRNYKIMIIVFGEGSEETPTTILEGKFIIENIAPPPIEQIFLVILAFISGFLIIIVVILRKRLRSVESVLELKQLRIGICLGTFSDEGLFIRKKSDNCPYEESSLSSMLEYSAVLLQRGELHKIYGPFPQQKDEILNIEWYNVSYGFQVVDTSIQDSRIVKSGGFTPALLLFFYPRQFDSLFMLQKREVEKFLKNAISDNIELSVITAEFLDDIGDQLYKLLLGYKPIKIDEVLANSDL